MKTSGMGLIGGQNSETTVENIALAPREVNPDFPPRDFAMAAKNVGRAAGVAAIFGGVVWTALNFSKIYQYLENIFPGELTLAQPLRIVIAAGVFAGAYFYFKFLPKYFVDRDQLKEEQVMKAISHRIDELRARIPADSEKERLEKVERAKILLRWKIFELIENQYSLTTYPSAYFGAAWSLAMLGAVGIRFLVNNLQILDLMLWGGSGVLGAILFIRGAILAQRAMDRLIEQALQNPTIIRDITKNTSGRNLLGSGHDGGDQAMSAGDRNVKWGWRIRTMAMAAVILFAQEALAGEVWSRLYDFVFWPFGKDKGFWNVIAGIGYFFLFRETVRFADNSKQVREDWSSISVYLYLNFRLYVGFGIGPTTHSMRSALANPNDFVRRLAYRWFKRQGFSGVIERALADSSEIIQVEAASWLPPEERNQRLRNWLKLYIPARAEALKWLIRHNDLVGIRMALQNEEFDIRLKAFRWLKKHGDEEGMRIALKDSAQRIRWPAYKWFMKSGDISTVRKGLMQSNEFIRSKAAKWLRQSGEPIPTYVMMLLGVEPWSITLGGRALYRFANDQGVNPGAREEARLKHIERLEGIDILLGMPTFGSELHIPLVGYSREQARSSIGRFAETLMTDVGWHEMRAYQFEGDDLLDLRLLPAYPAVFARLLEQALGSETLGSIRNIGAHYTIGADLEGPLAILALALFYGDEEYHLIPYGAGGADVGFPGVYTYRGVTVDVNKGNVKHKTPQSNINLRVLGSPLGEKEGMVLNKTLRRDIDQLAWLTVAILSRRGSLLKGTYKDFENQFLVWAESLSQAETILDRYNTGRPAFRGREIADRIRAAHGAIAQTSGQAVTPALDEASKAVFRGLYGMNVEEIYEREITRAELKYAQVKKDELAKLIGRTVRRIQEIILKDASLIDRLQAYRQADTLEGLDRARYNLAQHLQGLISVGWNLGEKAIYRKLFDVVFDSALDRLGSSDSAMAAGNSSHQEKARALEWFRGFIRRVVAIDRAESRGDGFLQISRREFLRLSGAAAVSMGLDPKSLVEELGSQIGPLVSVSGQTLAEVFASVISQERLNFFYGLGLALERIGEDFEHIEMFKGLQPRMYERAAINNSAGVIARAFWNHMQESSSPIFFLTPPELALLNDFFESLNAPGISHEERFEREKVLMRHPNVLKILRVSDDVEHWHLISQIQFSEEIFYPLRDVLGMQERHWAAIKRIEAYSPGLEGARVLRRLVDEGSEFLREDVWFQAKLRQWEMKVPNPDIREEEIAPEERKSVEEQWERMGKRFEESMALIHGAVASMDSLRGLGLFIAGRSKGKRVELWVQWLAENTLPSAVLVWKTKRGVKIHHEFLVSDYSQALLRLLDGRPWPKQGSVHRIIFSRGSSAPRILERLRSELQHGLPGQTTVTKVSDDSAMAAKVSQMSAQNDDLLLKGPRKVIYLLPRIHQDVQLRSLVKGLISVESNYLKSSAVPDGLFHRKVDELIESETVLLRLLIKDSEIVAELLKRYSDQPLSIGAERTDGFDLKEKIEMLLRLKGVLEGRRVHDIGPTLRALFLFATHMEEFLAVDQYLRVGRSVSVFPWEDAKLQEASAVVLGTLMELSQELDQVSHGKVKESDRQKFNRFLNKGPYQRDLPSLKDQARAVRVFPETAGREIAKKALDATFELRSLGQKREEHMVSTLLSVSGDVLVMFGAGHFYRVNFLLQKHMEKYKDIKVVVLRDAQELLVAASNDSAMAAKAEEQIAFEKEVKVRLQAVRRLGKNAGEQAIDGLIKALRDSDDRIRREAVFSLGRIGGDRTVDALIEELFILEQFVVLHARVRREVIRWLESWYEDGRAVDSLVAAESLRTASEAELLVSGKRLHQLRRVRAVVYRINIVIIHLKRLGIRHVENQMSDPEYIDSVLLMRDVLYLAEELQQRKDLSNEQRQMILSAIKRANDPELYPCAEIAPHEVTLDYLREQLVRLGVMEDVRDSAMAAGGWSRRNVLAGLIGAVLYPQEFLAEESGRDDVLRVFANDLDWDGAVYWAVFNVWYELGAFAKAPPEVVAALHALKNEFQTPQNLTKFVFAVMSEEGQHIGLIQINPDEPEYVRQPKIEEMLVKFDHAFRDVGRLERRSDRQKSYRNIEYAISIFRHGFKYTHNIYNHPEHLLKPERLARRKENRAVMANYFASVHAKEAAGAIMDVWHARGYVQNLDDRLRAVLHNRFEGDIVLFAYFMRALITQETSFDKDLTSRAAARGLTQFIEGTWKRMARSLRLTKQQHIELQYPKAAFEPHKSVLMSGVYIATLLGLFGRLSREQALELALAGYNSGEGRFQKIGFRIPRIPETQEYVILIMAKYEGYRRRWLEKKEISLPAGEAGSKAQEAKKQEGEHIASGGDSAMAARRQRVKPDPNRIHSGPYSGADLLKVVRKVKREKRDLIYADLKAAFPKLKDVQLKGFVYDMRKKGWKITIARNKHNLTPMRQLIDGTRDDLPAIQVVLAESTNGNTQYLSVNIGPVYIKGLNPDLGEPGDAVEVLFEAGDWGKDDTRKVVLHFKSLKDPANIDRREIIIRRDKTFSVVKTETLTDFGLYRDHRRTKTPEDLIAVVYRSWHGQEIVQFGGIDIGGLPKSLGKAGARVKVSFEKTGEKSRSLWAFMRPASAPITEPAHAIRRLNFPNGHVRVVKNEMGPDVEHDIRSLKTETGLDYHRLKPYIRRSSPGRLRRAARLMLEAEVDLKVSWLTESSLQKVSEIVTKERQRRLRKRLPLAGKRDIRNILSFEFVDKILQASFSLEEYAAKEKEIHGHYRFESGARIFRSSLEAAYDIEVQALAGYLAKKRNLGLLTYSGIIKNAPLKAMNSSVLLKMALGFLAQLGFQLQYHENGGRPAGVVVLDIPYPIEAYFSHPAGDAQMAAGKKISGAMFNNPARSDASHRMDGTWPTPNQNVALDSVNVKENLNRRAWELNPGLCRAAWVLARFDPPLRQRPPLGPFYPLKAKRNTFGQSFREFSKSVWMITSGRRLLGGRNSEATGSNITSTPREVNRDFYARDLSRGSINKIKDPRGSAMAAAMDWEVIPVPIRFGIASLWVAAAPEKKRRRRTVITTPALFWPFWKRIWAWIKATVTFLGRHKDTKAQRFEAVGGSSLDSRDSRATSLALRATSNERRATNYGSTVRVQSESADLSTIDEPVEYTFMINEKGRKDLIDDAAMATVVQGWDQDILLRNLNDEDDAAFLAQIQIVRNGAMSPPTMVAAAP